MAISATCLTPGQFTDVAGRFLSRLTEGFKLPSGWILRPLDRQTPGCTVVTWDNPTAGRRLRLRLRVDASNGIYLALYDGSGDIDRGCGLLHSWSAYHPMFEVHQPASLHATGFDHTELTSQHYPVRIKDGLTVQLPGYDPHLTELADDIGHVILTQMAVPAIAA